MTTVSSIEDEAARGNTTFGPVSSGDQTLTAGTGPEIFDFRDISFGNDTIAGFDPTRVTIELPKTLAADFATLQHNTTSVSGSTLITLNSKQSITLTGVAPDKLSSGNFLFA